MKAHKTLVHRWLIFLEPGGWQCYNTDLFQYKLNVASALAQSTQQRSKLSSQDHKMMNEVFMKFLMHDNVELTTLLWSPDGCSNYDNIWLITSYFQGISNWFYTKYLLVKTAMPTGDQYIIKCWGDDVVNIRWCGEYQMKWL